jgi:tRNA A-37 threonylcarbamoyl transferase component Bud32
VGETIHALAILLYVSLFGCAEAAHRSREPIARNRLAMISLKNSQRSIVKLAFDGLVHKQYHGGLALQRLANEVRVLQFLEIADCPFVPRVMDYSLENMTVILSNCGQSVQQLSDSTVSELFDRLRQFDVQHDDPCLRNITYHTQQGCFCIVDFEFAQLLKQTPTMNKVEREFESIEILLQQVSNTSAGCN